MDALSICSEKRGLSPVSPILMSHIYPVLERVLLTLWVGGLWVVGFSVAPTLFLVLPDTATAGTLAGALFTRMSWIGLACGALLLLLGWLQRAAHARRRQWLLVAGMLVLTAVGEYLLAPMIAELRAAGQVASSQFGQLHALASGVYLANCLLGLALVVVWPAACRRDTG